MIRVSTQLNMIDNDLVKKSGVLYIIQLFKEKQQQVF